MPSSDSSLGSLQALSPLARFNLTKVIVPPSLIFFVPTLALPVLTIPSQMAQTFASIGFPSVFCPFLLVFVW